MSRLAKAVELELEGPVAAYANGPSGPSGRKSVIGGTDLNKTLRKVGALALAAPAFLIVVVLFLYPFASSFLDSFRSESSKGPTLDNYSNAFRYYGTDIWYTVLICAISLVLVLLVAGLIGGILRLTSFPIVEFLFTIPLFVPFVVVGHAMRIFLAPHGTLNSALTLTHLFSPDSLPSFAFSSAGLVAALVWKHLGLALLLVLGACRGISNEYLDAARNAGAGPVRLVGHFIVPMAKGTFGVVAILTVTSMFGNFSIPAMIGSGGGPGMLMLDLYDAITTRQDYGLASAFGVISYVFSLGAAIYYLRTLRKPKS